MRTVNSPHQPLTTYLLPFFIILLFSTLSLSLSLPHNNNEGGTHPGSGPNTTHPQPLKNHTFTLTTIKTNFSSPSPLLLHQTLLVTPRTGLSSAVVYPSNTTTIPCNTTELLTLYIYNGDVYRKCTTSPTGGCIGFLTKAYGGALTGWYWHFSEDEETRNLGPGSGPIRGGWRVGTDPEDESGKRLVLYNGGGGAVWALCGYMDGQPYSINSITVPPYAVNGPYCSQHGFKFKVKYNKR